MRLLLLKQFLKSYLPSEEVSNYIKEYLEY